MAKKKKGLATLALLIIGAGAGFGVLDTAGAVAVTTILIFLYLLWSSAKKGHLDQGFGTGDVEEELSYQERIAEAKHEKEVLNILQERERQIFNNNIYLNPQNTIWDTYEIDRGEGESTSIKGFLVQDKSTNQDMLFHIDEGTGKIKRRSQRLEHRELYDLFENSAFIDSVEKHKFSSNNKVIGELKRMMKQQNQPQSDGLQLDKDDQKTQKELKEADDVPRSDWREVG